MTGALTAFRQFTHTEPVDPRQSATSAMSAIPDLIIFMMETGAAQALDLGRRSAAVCLEPGCSSRVRSSPGRHYTTHPYSSDALYSVFSGHYPQGRRRVLRKAAPGSLNGLMTNLSA